MTDKDEKSSEESTGPVSRQLLRARSVLLFGPIESKLTRATITQLLALNQMDGEKPIRLYINSPGGLADDGFAIYDVMRFVAAPVYSIVTGLAASAATILLMGAEKQHRYATPHARIMLHQPSQGARGTASDIAITAREIIRLRQKANALFAAETGHPLDKIEKDMHRDFWMSAEEAVEYGLLSSVLHNESDLPA